MHGVGGVSVAADSPLTERRSVWGSRAIVKWLMASDNFLLPFGVLPLLRPGYLCQYSPVGCIGIRHASSTRAEINRVLTIQERIVYGMSGVPLSFTITSRILELGTHGSRRRREQV